MFDNQLIILTRNIIISQEAIAGIPNTPIKQAFQPTQQGVNTVPSAYIYKVMDKRLGSPYRVDVWDEVNSVMHHTEEQWYETTFQISALSTQDPSDTSQMTASDLLNMIAYIMQSTTTIEAFQAENVGLLRVTDVRNPYFVDDRDRHEANPSFDYVLTHKQIVTNDTNVLQSTEFSILPV